MDHNAVNAFVAQSWPGLTTLLSDQIDAAVKDASFLNRTLRLLNPVVTADFRAAPGFTTPPTGAPTTGKTLGLALPNQGSWSLRIQGTLNGSTPIGRVDNKPIDLKISGLQILGYLSYNDSDPDRPRVVEFGLSPALSISSQPLEATIQPGQWVRSSDSSKKLKAPVRVRLGALIDTQITVDGTLILSLTQEPFLSLSLNVTILNVRVNTITFTLISRLPEALDDILTQLRSGQVPRDFGKPPAVPPRPMISVGSFVLPDEARTIETGLDAHLSGGTVFDGIYPAAGQAKLYRGERDSAIWTGHLLAAQAFRFASAEDDTERAAARKRVTELVAGISRLFSVPQAAVRAITSTTAPAPRDAHGLMARSVLPVNQATKTDPPYNTGIESRTQKDKSRHYYTQAVTLPDGTQWRAFGRDADPPSRDQIIGVVLGLGMTYKLVPEQRTTVRPLLRNLLTFLVDNHWNFPTPTGPEPFTANSRYRLITSFVLQFHQQLALLKVGALTDSSTPGEDTISFHTLYNQAFAAVGELAWLSPWFDTFDPIYKYYKFNLDMACYGLLLFLEEDSARRAVLERGKRVLRRALGGHRNAHFNLMWAIDHEQSARNQKLQSLNGYDHATSVAEETIQLLKEISQRRFDEKGPNQLLTQRTPTIRTSTPQNPPQTWLAVALTSGASDTSLGNYLVDYTPLGRAEKNQLAANFALPVHLRPGRDMDFLWQRPPFQTGLSRNTDGTWKMDFGGENGNDPGAERIESPGIDFLLPYYMARFFDIL